MLNGLQTKTNEMAAVRIDHVILFEKKFIENLKVAGKPEVRVRTCSS